MHNFNNKRSISQFQHNNTQPSPRHSRELSAIAQKQDNATECLILISQIQDDSPMDSCHATESDLLSRIEVAPWAHIRRRLDGSCTRSKTSMLLPPCNYRAQPTNQEEKKKKKGENKENYLSIDKLSKEEKITINKKNSIQVKKSSSAISNYNQPGECQSAVIKQLGETRKQKPHIVYVHCEEPNYEKAKERVLKKSEANETCLAPIVIGKCNIIKKNSQFGDWMEREKPALAKCPTEGIENLRLRKNAFQGNQGRRDNRQTCLTEPVSEPVDEQKGKENREYWKIKKKIEERIKKESHIKLSLEERRNDSKQLKKYMKYSQSKTRHAHQSLTESSSLYQSGHPVTKHLFQKYKEVVSRCY